MSSHFVNNPDFKDIVIRKKPTVVPRATSGGYQQSHESKIDKQTEEGNFKIKKYEASFLQKIQEFRRVHSMNQEAFARHCGVPVQDIKHIENNTLPYNPRLVEKIHAGMNKRM